MNELALFAGAGGGILGGKLLGWRTVCAVEINPFCREVLLRRQLDGCLPKFPIWDDIRTFDGRPWRGSVDVCSGGFPCQDISLAGKGIGITGPSSGLWKEMFRVVCEVRPQHIFVENSPALTIRGLGVVLRDLASMGFDAEWCVLGAHQDGGIHIRERIWLHGSYPYSLRPQGRRKNREKYQNGQRAREQFERLLESEARMAIPAGKDKRKSDGVAYRLDRLKAIGNGQVPGVAALAWDTLTSKT